MKKIDSYKFFRSRAWLGLCLFAINSCTPVTPDYDCIRQMNAQVDHSVIENNVQIPEFPLTLKEIVEISLCRNLDLQLQEIEQCMYDKNTISAMLQQLPSLTTNYELSWRNKEPRWYSEVDGVKSTHSTQSSQQTVNRFDLTAAWNILDFGLTYLKTRQEQNRGLLLCQRHLRARQNLVLDVYRAYYRAIVALKAKDQAEDLIKRLGERQELLSLQLKKQLIPEMKGLLNENRLLDMQVRLQAFNNEYYSAMTELAGLMGLAPGTDFELSIPDLQRVKLGPVDVLALENTALNYRPELMAQEMQIFIDADEVRTSMLRMFPNVDFFAGYWHDADDFLVHQNWLKIGGHVSWDLLSLPYKWYDIQGGEYRTLLNMNSRLSMSMGVLTQVHLSLINVNEMLSQFKLANDLNSVKRRQLEVAKLLEKRGQIDEDDVIDFEVEALFAEVNALKGYSNIQVALEQLGNSIGRPLYFTKDFKDTYYLALEQCSSYDVELVAAEFHQSNFNENFFYEDFLLYDDEFSIVQKALQRESKRREDALLQQQLQQQTAEAEGKRERRRLITTENISNKHIHSRYQNDSGVDPSCFN